MFSRTANTRPRSRAFTLVEMAVVIAIIAILSATAIPALASLEGARQAAAAQEVERMLLTARTQAVSAGRPWGVEVDFTNQRVRYVRIATIGAAPTPPPATGKGTADWLNVPAQYPDASISNLILGSGASNASGTVWFDTTGNPAVRNASGTRTGPATADAEFTFAGGFVIRVRQLTGAIERE